MNGWLAVLVHVALHSALLDACRHAEQPVWLIVNSMYRRHALHVYNLLCASYDVHGFCRLPYAMMSRYYLAMSTITTLLREGEASHWYG